MGICYMTQRTQTGTLTILVGWDGEGDRREFQEGGNICIPIADSC